MEIKNGVSAFHAINREAWREWLIQNGDQEKSVWLIIYKKESGVSSVYYNEAVDEALCYGWIDSKPNKRDDNSYYQYFANRNPKSNWSKVNKDKVLRLEKEGRIAEQGRAMIALAKSDGTWDALNEVDNLIEPTDLAKALNQNLKAKVYWGEFPPSAKRGILEWIFNAKRPETRAIRIAETVRLAQENIRANQFKK